MTYVHADVDECQLGVHTCDQHAGCVNTIGWYECSCNVGYTGNGINCSELQGSIAIILYYYHFCCLLYPGCSNGQVLLQNETHLSANLTEGTVLVCYNNEYGTVCDDFWDDLEAAVVCGQLGFSEEGILLCI